jgi:hypothetical protein
MSKSIGSHYTRPGRCVSRPDKREWTKHLLAKPNKIPPASPAPTAKPGITGNSYCQYRVLLSSADAALSTAVISTDRIPTVQEPGGLQLFRSRFGAPRSVRSVFWSALLMAYRRSPCILLPRQYPDAPGQRLYPSNP